MNGSLKKTAIAAVAALALGAGVAVSTTAPAEARVWHKGGYYGGHYRSGWWGPAIGLGILGGVSPARRSPTRGRITGPAPTTALAPTAPTAGSPGRSMTPGAATSARARLTSATEPASAAPLPRWRPTVSVAGLGRRPPPRRPEEEAPPAERGLFAVQASVKRCSAFAWRVAIAAEVQVGMVGVNAPIPAPLADFTFGGWKRAGFGNVNQRGPDASRVYTKTKAVTSRWPSGVKEGASFVIPTMN